MLKIQWLSVCGYEINENKESPDYESGHKRN